ncbi:MAG: radical SAM protein [Thermoleophilia bacterium]
MMELDWIDEFIANIRPYIMVREEDNLLIRMPNQAHRLNSQGVRILKHLLDGGTMTGLRQRLGGDPQKIEDAGLFLYEIKRCLEGKLKENNYSSAVVARPLTLGFSKLPVLSEVAVTSRCNLRCAFCYYGCAHAAPRSAKAKPQMTADQIRRVLKIIHNEARTPSVSFTGGEPTLRDDLPELVGAARDIGLRVNLITNGTRVTPALADELVAAGLDSVQVSLEGTTPLVHDSITGVAGSFSRSVAAVGHFRDRGITVHTNTTLNLRNLADSVAMPHFVARTLGLERFSMNLVIPSGSATTGSTGAQPLLIRYRDVAPMVKAVLAASKREGVEFMWYSPTPLCLFNPIIEGLGNKGCSACDGLLSVDCNGDVLPCSSWAEPVGNLLTTGFKEIWDSKFAASCRQKEMAHPDCRHCDSFAVCHGACPLYWRHFGFGELSMEQRLVI